MTKAALIGIGSALPPDRVTNDDLAQVARHVGRMDHAAHRHP